MAQLKGKLIREEEGMEDLITSNVFGSFKYVSPRRGLLPFLARATGDGGTKPLEDLPPVKACSYVFWPRYGTADDVACEPDVLISIMQHNGTELHIMVEAKYRSPKSSFPSDGEQPTDQLAREWCVLEKIAGGSDNAFLLFVTADYVRPWGQIRESQDELILKRGGRGNILWVSWRELPTILQGSKHPMLRDLHSLLAKYGLDFFRGFHLGGVIDCAWAFTEGPSHFYWTGVAYNIPWFFSPGQEFTWETDAIIINWGFKHG